MKVSTFKLGLLGVIAMSTLAPIAQAEDSPWGPITAGVSLTSDYRFRGVSQSDRDAAVQGWIQYDHASGFFANIWASSIDFNDAPVDSNVEVDLSAGYNFKLGGDTNASVRALYYWYADADIQSGDPEYDYWEFAAGLEHSFGNVTVTGDLAYSPDFFNETGDAWALTGGASVPVLDSFAFFTGGLEASAHVGHQWIDQGVDYLYYDFGATAKWEQFSVDLRWVDTDMNTAECGSVHNCDGGIVLSVSADLPG